MRTYLDKNIMRPLFARRLLTVLLLALSVWLCSPGTAEAQLIRDRDDDGVGAIADNCIDVANADQADSDGDGVGDACDNCPDESNKVQADVDEDGIDNACDDDSSDDTGTDADGDAYFAGEDCDDDDSQSFPGAEEICDDSIDQDCDGVTTDCSATVPDDGSDTLDGSAEDHDDDGYVSSEDCDDADPLVNPGAVETCGDNIDEDCDGVTAPACEVSDVGAEDTTGEAGTEDVPDASGSQIIAVDDGGAENMSAGGCSLTSARSDMNESSGALIVMSVLTSIFLLRWLTAKVG